MKTEKQLIQYPFTDFIKDIDLKTCVNSAVKNYINARSKGEELFAHGWLYGVLTTMTIKKKITEKEMNYISSEVNKCKQNK